MTRRRIFFCATLLVAFALSLLTAPRAWADDPNRASDLKISVWPEYDQPTVLVMLDGTLADSTNLPREIAVLVPSNATLLVTTYENTDGTLAAEQSSKSTSAGDGYLRVTYTVKSAKYHVEYYDNILKGAPDKTLDFSYKTVAPADKVTLEFQQPAKASNFTMNPTASGTRNESGFNYYSTQLANVTAGQVVSAQVTYTKTDPNPSVSPTSASSTTPAGASAPAAAPSALNSIYLVVALVVLGLAAVLGFFMLQRRSREAFEFPVGGSGRSKSAGRRAKVARHSGGTAFCTQCGHDLGAADNFCPKCGARRRVPG